ncbi:hypothetical protein [Porphyromonas macacae]|uniref:hypothetical protein n=1 Tax=Porphyromonas macacae TaxID=28115 RepID=UPI00036DF1F6|nr:hypothetical protein [Porphyromonas macacae]
MTESFFSTRHSTRHENLVDEIFCLMVQNPSGKEKKSKLTSLKILQAKDFEPSGREFLCFLKILLGFCLMGFPKSDEIIFCSVFLTTS